MKQIKATFFKETGKYYTEEMLDIPESITEVYAITDYIEQNYKGKYKGMHLVAMLEEYPNGYPIMIPADKRR